MDQTILSDRDAFERKRARRVTRSIQKPVCCQSGRGAVAIVRPEHNVESTFAVGPFAPFVAFLRLYRKGCDRPRI
jgi:hypothetical protein